ncbi:MAG: nitrilase-related carbon-nitrogen hydrolase [Bacteroidales bacterium]|nr:nitrilase-related carbon-nitrogen hydrolase [Bacteroidales bacterium]
MSWLKRKATGANAPYCSPGIGHTARTSLYENHLERGKSIRILKDYISRNPDKAIVIGASTYYVFDEDEEIPLSARPFSNSDRYYNAYNTAIYMDDTADIQLYHKSKLTPGVEKMPFKSLFRPVEDFAIDLGGTVGTLGTDPERIPFTTSSKEKIAPIICYESIYGEFCTRFVHNGATAFLNHHQRRLVGKYARAPAASAVCHAPRYRKPPQYCTISQYGHIGIH